MKNYNPEHTTKKLKIERGFCLGVLTTAIEGGSAYWAEASRVKRNSEHYVTSADMRSFEGSDPKPQRTWKTVDALAIHRAILKVLLGEVQAGGYIRAQFAGYPGAHKDCDYDAEGADVIVQVALYNEIIYG
jgi:hypothetical protein